MASTSRRYATLSRAPYGGVRGPIPTFATSEAAAAWGASAHRGVEWVVVSARVYTQSPTYALIAALEYGGAGPRISTFADPVEALRYGQYICEACDPRAVVMISSEGARAPAAARFADDGPGRPARPWAAKESADDNAVRSARRPRPAELPPSSADRRLPG